MELWTCELNLHFELVGNGIEFGNEEFELLLRPLNFKKFFKKMWFFRCSGAPELTTHEEFSCFFFYIKKNNNKTRLIINFPKFVMVQPACVISSWKLGCRFESLSHQCCNHNVLWLTIVLDLYLILHLGLIPQIDFYWFILSLIRKSGFSIK